MSTTAVPPILTTLVGRLAAAVPGRARTTFAELLIGAAVTRGGHVTDATLAAGLSRSWTSYYWLLERGRWSWPPGCRAPGPATTGCWNAAAGPGWRSGGRCSGR